METRDEAVRMMGPMLVEFIDHRLAPNDHHFGTLLMEWARLFVWFLTAEFGAADRCEREHVSHLIAAEAARLMHG
jgi:hypothetical protein